MDFTKLLYEAQSLENDGEIQKAWDIYIKILSSNELQERHSEGYFQFAIFLFQNKCYDEALEMFIESYELGYKQQEILNIIEDAYCKLNIETFKKIYQENIQALSLLYPNLEVFSFESLPLKFIPSSESNFYIFNNNNQKFVGRFSLDSTSINGNSKEVLMIRNEYNVNIIKEYDKLTKGNNAPLYLIFDELDIFLSHLQSINLCEIIKNPRIKIFFTLIDFINYFNIIENRLPDRIVNASLVDEYVEFIEHIQMTRNNSNILQITPYQSSNLSKTAANEMKLNWKKASDDIVLSFCIPTYNRGHRAIENVKHILKSSYEKEIEVVVCDNNSLDVNGEYRELSLINDLRVKYYKNQENIGFAGNLIKVIKHARGKFVYIISDEDYVALNSVPSLLDMLKLEENIAVIKGSMQPKDEEVPPGNSCKFNADIVLPQGLNAFSSYGFVNNYISGTIYNRDRIIENKLYEKVIDNIAEHDAYPHLYLEALLCTQGNVKVISDTICLEGRSECDSNALSQGVYSYGSRLKQHRAFVHILNEVFDLMNCNDTLQKANIYLGLCTKVFNLVANCNGPYYEQNGQNLSILLKDTYFYCLSTVSESFDSIRFKLLLEQHIKTIFKKYSLD